MFDPPLLDVPRRIPIAHRGGEEDRSAADQEVTMAPRCLASGNRASGSTLSAWGGGSRSTMKPLSLAL